MLYFYSLFLWWYFRLESWRWSRLASSGSRIFIHLYFYAFWCCCTSRPCDTLHCKPFQRIPFGLRPPCFPETFVAGDRLRRVTMMRLKHPVWVSYPQPGQCGGMNGARSFLMFFNLEMSLKSWWHISVRPVSMHMKGFTFSLLLRLQRWQTRSCCSGSLKSVLDR